MANHLRIQSVSAVNVASFRNLSLEFNPSYNLICGSNGVGKTSLLNIIAGAISGFAGTQHVRLNAIAASEGVAGKWSAQLLVNSSVESPKGEVTAFLPDDRARTIGVADHSFEMVYLTTKRDFAYTRLNAISRDPTKNKAESQSEAVNGLNSEEIKTWFANRYLLRHHGGDWPADRIRNLDLAVNAFSVLDPTVRLSRVDTSTFDILVSTPSGEIPFEYLSSGFRAAFVVLLGIIKEIEFRKLGCSAEGFSGVVLVDELDLHLHPAWQRIMPRAVRKLFPKAQIIATTHSPHMIQEADAEEVISLQIDSSGQTYRAPLESSKYGFKGWTIEEILKDVMGVDGVRPDVYEKAMYSFDKAVDAEDPRGARKWLKELELMLHPSNHLRKILRLQAAPVVERPE